MPYAGPRPVERPVSGGSLPDAVVFDLDGVITFTARLHFAAWKALFDDWLRARSEAGGEPFRPFTEADYSRYVDGRPRLDGVRTFLASRGIGVPEGDPSDPPGRGTVHALGRRKNEIFRERLRREGVDVDPEAVRLARGLREAGVRVGVASSSKNTDSILEAVGLADLFVARVDGVLSERLGLRGKPAPDIFLACLERLGGTDPDRAVVVEDAVAGVEAGRAGGFGLVLGVDRDDHAIPLREHGADWVVRGFRGIDVDRLRAWFANRAHARPNALAEWPRLARAFEDGTPAVFLDYDGTLTPIVDRPEFARLPGPMRDTLQRLARAWPTTVVSGRARADVQRMVGLDGINYAGSHGFDIAGPGAGDGVRLDVAEEAVPAVAAAAREIRERTSGTPGVIVEDKTYSVAVHYRLVDEARVPEVERAVDEALENRPELRKTLRKMVFELRPAVDWDKGRAVLWLIDALGLGGPDVCPIYIGDDVTDEDAFRALGDRGAGIVVTELPRPTAARWSLQDVPEVRAFLERLGRLSRNAGPGAGTPIDRSPTEETR